MKKDEDYDDLKVSWSNFKSDVKVSALLILPAETAFVATSVPLLGISAFIGAKLAALKAGATVLIGGASAKIAAESISELTKEKSMPNNSTENSKDPLGDREITHEEVA